MKLIDEKINFIHSSPKTPKKPMKNSNSSKLMFIKKINLDENDYFIQYGLKKNNKFIGSFLSSNEETKQSLDSQKRINSDIYERLKNEDEHFIKTLLRLKQKMNDSQTNSVVFMTRNKNLSSQNIYNNSNRKIEISPYNHYKYKKEKDNKIKSNRKKINLSGYSIYNKSSNRINSNHSKSNSKIINTPKKNNVSHIRTFSCLYGKSMEKKNIKNHLNQKDNQNSSKNNIYQIYKKSSKQVKIVKNINYEFKKKVRNKKVIPTAVIDLFDDYNKKKNSNKMYLIKKIKKI
jgi:hypothetical protein